jgi:hypothetical protein
MAASSASSYWQALSTSTPLQAGDPAPGDAGSSGDTSNAAGASGADNGSFGQISKGGLIAIVVVVALVVIFGSEQPVLEMTNQVLTLPSCIISAVLSSKKEILGGQGNHQKVSQKGCDRSHPKKISIPQRRNGDKWKELKRTHETG